jgi:hypothetical protein
MTQVPYWIQVLQALATPAIAGLALVIGLMQWRTSHQRAALDLFDKRFELYMELRAIISQVLTHGTVHQDTAIVFLRAADKAQFLFGPKVTAYLNSVYKLLVEHGNAEDMMKMEGPEYEKWVKKKYDAFGEISKFYVLSLTLIQPYIRMHQKAPLV